MPDSPLALAAGDPTDPLPPGVGASVGGMVGTGVGIGVGLDVGLGVGLGVGTGVGTGVGSGVGPVTVTAGGLTAERVVVFTPDPIPLFAANE